MHNNQLQSLYQLLKNELEAYNQTYFNLIFLIADRTQDGSRIKMVASK